MKYRDACTRQTLNGIEHRAGRTAAVNGEDATTRRLTCGQNACENFLLVGPIRPELRGAVEPHLTDVSRFR